MTKAFHKTEVMSLKALMDACTKNHLSPYFPVYQRDYVWGQGQDASIVDCLKKQLKSLTADASKTLFLQTLVVCENREDHQLEIVDGQQRLRTLARLLDHWPCPLNNIFGDTSKQDDQVTGRFSFDELSDRIFFLVRPVSTAEVLPVFLALNRISLGWHDEDHWLAKIKNLLSANPERLKTFNRDIDTLYLWSGEEKLWFEVVPPHHQKARDEQAAFEKRVFKREKTIDIFADTVALRSDEQGFKQRALLIQMLQLAILDASGVPVDSLDKEKSKTTVTGNSSVLNSLHRHTDPHEAPLQALTDAVYGSEGIGHCEAEAIATSVGKLVHLLQALTSQPALRQRLVLAQAAVDIKHVSKQLLTWMRQPTGPYRDDDQLKLQVKYYDEEPKDKDKLYARDWLIHYDFTVNQAQGLKDAFAKVLKLEASKVFEGDHPLKYPMGLNVNGGLHIEHWVSRESAEDKKQCDKLHNKALLSSSINESLSNKSPKEKAKRLGRLMKGMMSANEDEAEKSDSSVEGMTTANGVWPSVLVLSELVNCFEQDLKEKDFYQHEQELWDGFIESMRRLSNDTEASC